MQPPQIVNNSDSKLRLSAAAYALFLAVWVALYMEAVTWAMSLLVALVLTCTALLVWQRFRDTDYLPIVFTILAAASLLFVLLGPLVHGSLWPTQWSLFCGLFTYALLEWIAHTEHLLTSPPSDKGLATAMYLLACVFYAVVIVVAVHLYNVYEFVPGTVDLCASMQPPANATTCSVPPALDTRYLWAPDIPNRSECLYKHWDSIRTALNSYVALCAVAFLAGGAAWKSDDDKKRARIGLLVIIAILLMFLGLTRAIDNMTKCTVSAETLGLLSGSMLCQLFAYIVHQQS